MKIDHLIPLRSQAPAPPVDFTPVGLPAAPESPKRPAYDWLDKFLLLEPNFYTALAEELKDEWLRVDDDFKNSFYDGNISLGGRLEVGFLLDSAAFDFWEWCTATDEHFEKWGLWNADRLRLTALQWPWVWAQQSYAAGLAVLGDQPPPVSIWHHPDEEPEKGERLLCSNGVDLFEYRNKKGYSWIARASGASIRHWSYVSDLPK